MAATCVCSPMAVPIGEVAKGAPRAMGQVLLCFGVHMEMGASENLTSTVNAEGHEGNSNNCSQNTLES